MSVHDWWEKNLESYRQNGRDDADKGEFHWPHGFSDEFGHMLDPQDEAEDFAYKEGFDERRKELGKKFKWCYER